MGRICGRCDQILESQDANIGNMLCEPGHCGHMYFLCSIFSSLTPCFLLGTMALQVSVHGVQVGLPPTTNSVVGT